MKLHTADGREVVAERPPVRRFGRLAPPMGDSAAATHVRCACDECGAHLLGTPTYDGGASGVCLVCGGAAVRPL